MKTFNIPLVRDDLLSSCDQSFAVKSVTAAEYLPGKISEAWAQLKSLGPSGIVEAFDVFFSLISHFGALDGDTRRQGWKAVCGALCDQVHFLSHALSQQLPSGERQEAQTTVKMLCYLVVQLVECCEGEVSQPSITVQPTGRGRKGKKKAAVEGALGIAWETERVNALDKLLQLCQLDIARLWDPAIVEEEFINLVANCCYKLLENPANTKDKSTQDLIFQILGVFVQRHNHSLSAGLKVVQLLQHIGEHLAAPLSAAMEIFVNSFGNKAVLAETIREIGRLDVSDLSRDSSGSRALGLFLVETAERVPAAILPSISVLLPHLDGESYSLRNAVLAIMTEIVGQVLSVPDLQPAQRSIRDQFLDKLEEHIHDVHAFVRSRVLQLWLKLCSAKVIPLPRQQHLLQLVVGRIQDKSSFVRRSCVQLLTAMLRGNPFAAKLSTEQLQARLDVEQKRFELLQSCADTEADRCILDPLKEFSKLKPALKEQLTKLQSTRQKACNEEEEEEDEEDEDNGIFMSENGEEVAKQIFASLSAREVDTACRLLLKAHQTWQDEEAWSWSGVESESSEDENEGKQQRELRIVHGQLSRLKAIFLQHSPRPDTTVPLSLEELVNSVPSEVEKRTSEPVSAEQVGKQAVVVRYLQDATAFAKHLQDSIPLLCQLLGSKSSSDVMEAIEFFVAAQQFGLSAAMQGVRKMLMLMWSKEESVRHAVVDAYRQLYLQPPPTGSDSNRSHVAGVAANLIQLMCGMTLGEITSFEALVVEFMKSKLLPSGVLKFLWDKVSGKVTSNPGSKRAALLLLSMAASAEVDVVRSNLSVLIDCALDEEAGSDLVLVRYACIALQRLVPVAKTKGTYAAPFRLAEGHRVFARLKNIVITTVDQLNLADWLAMAEQAVNTIYALAEHPDRICGEILQVLFGKLVNYVVLPPAADGDSPELSLGPPVAESSQRAPSEEHTTAADSPVLGGVDKHLSECPAVFLTRFVSIMGQVALKQLVHLECAVLSELKRRRLQEEGAREKANSSKAPTDSNSKAEGETTLEDEMGLTGATADDAEAEVIRRICDSHLVIGDSAIIARLQPIVVYVCTNPLQFPDARLRTAAAVSLAKLMLVSADFCEAHLQLLFTILEKSSEPTIRGNTVIAVGDLMFRFPNLTEPWTPNLYARLRDKSPYVRKQTMMVLTHLILNDMVKVKGQISELAMCLEDADQRIADLAKLFFLELSQKGNAIYNILPDIISRLSDPDIGVAEQSFHHIMRYLFSFIQKDRQCESLVEKLCHRFRATRCERQWRDLSFCLSLLTYNERALRKLQANISCFQDKLSCDDVYNHFITVITKSKKAVKIDFKATLDEFEARITEFHTKGMEDEETATKASSSSKHTKQTSPAASGVQTKEESVAKPVKSASRTRQRPRRHINRTVDSDDDEFDAPASTKRVLTASRRANLPSAKKGMVVSKKHTVKRRALELSSSESESGEIMEENVDPKASPALKSYTLHKQTQRKVTVST